jgi:hypothetical protein
MEQAQEVVAGDVGSRLRRRFKEEMGGGTKKEVVGEKLRSNRLGSEA